MTTSRAFLSILALAVPPASQAPAASESLTRVARFAEQQLAKGVQDLGKLRDLIAAERIPLASELSALEEALPQLRRDHDRVTRTVDSGDLEVSNIKLEMKARQDEITYIGSLLDDYVRAFESRVNVCELQSCGAVIERAKQASENATLPAVDRLACQVEVAEVSTKRLFDVVGGARFPGVGVDMQGQVTDGHFTVVGPVAIFAADGNGAAGLVVPQAGSPNPLIRPLEGDAQAGLTALAQTGEGHLPLDPSLGGALKALVQKFNIVHVFEKGGPIMWPLLVSSVLALIVVIERLLFLMLEKWRRDPAAMQAFFAAVTKKDIAGAIQIGRMSKYYVVRALGYALGHREGSLANALVYSQAQELKRFQRGIPVLDTVITLAPLLGLLGTVTGMMGSFSIIGGDLGSPGAITGGIAEALIATAFGLGIAITALLPFNFLNARVEQARHEIESAATQLELLVQTQDRVHSGAPLASVLPRTGDEPQKERQLQRRRASLLQQLEELRQEEADHDRLRHGLVDGRSSVRAAVEAHGEV